jgi:hypothetical protein
MEPTLTARSERPRCLRVDCVNVAAHKGLCQSHYNEQRNQGRRCAIVDCDVTAFCKGLCRWHYQRSRQASRRCAIDGCAGRFYARGLCLRHYRQQIDAGDCAVDGCTEPAGPSGARGYCSLHYKRLRSRGEIGTAERERAPHLSTLPGRSWLDPQGYRRVKVNGAIRGVHQLVMERHLGRRLRAFESVHHRNGVRHDNAVCNLELWAEPHPPGQRVADLVGMRSGCGSGATSRTWPRRSTARGDSATTSSARGACSTRSREFRPRSGVAMSSARARCGTRTR